MELSAPITLTPIVVDAPITINEIVLDAPINYGVGGFCDCGFSLAPEEIIHTSGNEPLVPSLEHQKHIKKKSRYIAVVDFPENIRAAGLDPVEVTQAAIYWLDHGLGASKAKDEEGVEIGPGGTGYWVRGDVYLQSGTYEYQDQLDVPGRICLHGSGENIYDSGTRLLYTPGGELEAGGKDAFFAKQWGTDGNQYDASFFCHITDISFECEHSCSAVWWGGAQCSSARNLMIRNVISEGIGFGVGFGSNGLILQSVWVNGGEMLDNTAFHIEAYCHGISMIGCKSEVCGTGIYVTGATQLGIHDFYNEQNVLPLFIDGGGGGTVVNADGFSCKKVLGRDSSGRATIAKTTQNTVRLKIDGLARHMSDDEVTGIPVGIVTESGFVQVAIDIPARGDVRTFSFDQVEYFEARPQDLSKDNRLTWGRNYYDSYDDGANITYSLIFPTYRTRQRNIELYLICAGTATIGLPASTYITGTVGVTSSIVLEAGNHVLKFADMESTTRLTVD